MEREECEKAIAEQVEKIWEIYKQYNPKADSLSLHITREMILVNNEYWKDDIEKPLTRSFGRVKHDD